jgi:glycerol-3-phosphate cytidylyltransferase-like family protein
VLVSGGFDPLHRGHVALLQGASGYGLVYVALNSDAWLTRKKGYVFQTWAERAEILRECRSVFHVLPVQDDDDTVCSAIMSLQSDYFANGGDRTTPNEKENIACKASGTKQLFGIGGQKVQSSSSLIEKILTHREKT